MSYMPKGISVGQYQEPNESKQLPEEKMKQVFIITAINRINNPNYSFFAKDKDGNGFSFPTEEGLLSLGKVKVVGESELFCSGNFSHRDKVTTFGRWAKENGEVVFKADVIYEEINGNIESLRKFLEGGRLPKIRSINANKIIQRWGDKTFDILDFETEKLIEIPGITQEYIPAIKNKWLEIRSVYETISILGEYGVSEDIAKKAFKYYKELEEYNGESNNIVELIKKNPYELINIKGINFRKADDIAKKFGLSENSKKRIKACLLFCLDNIMQLSGNTAISANDWILEFSKETGFGLEKSQKCCQWLINENKVLFKKIKIIDEKGLPYEKEIIVSLEMQDVEKSIAKNLKRLVDSYKKIDDQDLLVIEKELQSKEIIADDTQKDAIRNTLTKAVSILTGGPGTGKTTTCKNIVNIFVNKLRKKVFLAAPTGKAAQRMGEQIGQGLESETIHKLLKAKSYFFEHNQYNQLPVGVYIIDESSMIDVFLCKALLEAIPNGSAVIFVGDKDQLQSVGAGDVLRDMISSEKIPVSILKEPHRYKNGADININASLINKGKLPNIKGSFENNSNFIFIQKQDDNGIMEEIYKTLSYLHDELNVPLKDIQILSPQKNKMVGVDLLNFNLRPIFNKHYEEWEKMDPKPKFYNGDKVMQTENDYENDLFNGDFGYIQNYSEEDGSFEFCDIIKGRIVKMGPSEANNLTLAYAITVHKSQGSESPYVIIPLSDNHHATLNRNNLYTGVTRAKKMVIVIGEVSSLRKTINKIKQRQRVTQLKDEILNIM